MKESKSWDLRGAEAEDDDADIHASEETLSLLRVERVEDRCTVDVRHGRGRTHGAQAEALDDARRALEPIADDHQPRSQSLQGKLLLHSSLFLIVQEEVRRRVVSNNDVTSKATEDAHSSCVSVLPRGWQQWLGS